MTEAGSSRRAILAGGVVGAGLAGAGGYVLWEAQKPIWTRFPPSVATLRLMRDGRTLLNGHETTPNTVVREVDNYLGPTRDWIPGYPRIVLWSQSGVRYRQLMHIIVPFFDELFGRLLFHPGDLPLNYLLPRLPNPTSAEINAEMDRLVREAVGVHVETGRRLYIGDTQTSLDRIVGDLRSRLKSRNEIVLIGANADVPVADFTEVHRKLSASGINVQVVVEDM